MVKVLSLHEETTSHFLFQHDIDMLGSINHPNVVELLAVCTNTSPKFILLDAGLPGDLLTYIRERRNTLSRRIATEPETMELLRIANEISIGMAYLTSERYIHKDLALRNCSISFDGVVKIAHFGLGPLIYPEAYYKVDETDLPIRWMAPEAITDASFTNMSDVWSFGVTLWELFTYGDLPFEDRSNEEVLEHVLNERRRLYKPIRCPSDVFDLMWTCWHSDPHSRPCFTDIHENLTELSEIPSSPSESSAAAPISYSGPVTDAMFGSDAAYIHNAYTPPSFKSKFISHPTS